MEGQLLPPEVMKKCSDDQQEIQLYAIDKFQNKEELAKDFMQKVKSKQISSLDEYISLVCRDNSKLLTQTAEHIIYLRNCEKQLLANITDVHEPDPMTESLIKYCLDNPLKSFEADNAFSRIKHGSDIYYQILRAIAYLFLLRSEKKKRCILLYGVTNSGKSTISKYLSEIFTSYDMR